MKFDTRQQEKELIRKGYIPSDKKKKSKFKLFNKNKNEKKLPAQTTLDIMPVKGLVGRENFIRLENGFTDIFELQGYNLAGASDAEIWGVIKQYENLVKLYVMPMKVLTLYTPLDTKKQQDYYLRQAKQATNPTHRDILMNNYYEMQFFEQNNYNKEFYIQIFADTVQELRENRQDFMQYKGTLNIAEVPLKKKRAIFFRLNNPTTTVYYNN